MAEVIWSEPALADLDAIADYIALDNPEAASNLVQHIFKHSDQLQDHPDSGPRLKEFKGSRYRQIIEPPCRVNYRNNKTESKVYIQPVIRSEQNLRPTRLLRRPK